MPPSGGRRRGRKSVARCSQGFVRLKGHCDANNVGGIRFQHYRAAITRKDNLLVRAPGSPAIAPKKSQPSHNQAFTNQSVQHPSSPRFHKARLTGLCGAAPAVGKLTNSVRSEPTQRRPLISDSFGVQTFTFPSPEIYLPVTSPARKRGDMSLSPKSIERLITKSTGSLIPHSVAGK